MEGLGIFEDLPQFDTLPAVGSDDRVNMFKDLPNLDCSSTALPAAGGKHAEEDTQQADLVGGMPSLPPFSRSCSDSSHLEPVAGGKSKRNAIS